MRIKLDENVTANAAPSLRTLGHDVDTVLDEALTPKRLAFGSDGPKPKHCFSNSA
jgi:hypothetical protein